MGDMTADQRRSASLIMSRCFWLLMGIGHTPAFIKAWDTFISSGMRIELAGGCMLLTASMILFALKTCDVACLRFRVDRRRFIAMVLAVGLIHFDCLVPTLDSAVVANGVAVVVTTSAMAEAFLSVRGRSRPTRRHVVSRVPLTLARRFAGNNLLDDARPHCWVLALTLFILRAPPV
ncbi:MAG: hypothetical protein ACE5HE_04985 [Phycisphaerae bacterium]